MKKLFFILISAMLLTAGCVYYPYGTYPDSAYYSYPDYSLSFSLSYPYGYYAPYYYPYHYPYYYGYRYPRGGVPRHGPYIRR